MKRAKGGEIRDEQCRRISALCATVLGTCAHLSGQGSADEPTRLRAGLVAFGASCASQPADRSKKVGADKRVVRDSRTLPSRQRTYIHLHVQVDRLEDSISHFYNVI